MKNKRRLATDQPMIYAFSKLRDPRVGGRYDHLLIDIIVITICAVISGANHWKQIAEFGKSRFHWFKQFLELPNGIPSHQTFCRVFSLIPAQDFLECFIKWSSMTNEKPLGDIVALDGKTLRKSFHKPSNQSAIHMINAFACHSGITLGSLIVPDKSNEISGIPRLLKMLDVSKCTVTCDAMGTQKGIAKLIVDKKAHYVLALKKNHKRFYRKVSTVFQKAQDLNYTAMVYRSHQTTDYDHSRYEIRDYCFLPIMYLHAFKKDWRNLQTLVQVTSKRETSEGIETSVRYYITSLSLVDYKKISGAIRQHWAIENKLHWQLDVSFHEDNSRIHNKNAAENISLIRKLALFYLEKETSCQAGIEIKRWKAALDNRYLRKVVNF